MVCVNNVLDSVSQIAKWMCIKNNASR